MRDAQRIAVQAQDQLDSVVPPLAAAGDALEDLEVALAGGSAELLGFLAQQTATRSVSDDTGNDPGRASYKGFVDAVVTPREEFKHLLAFEDERARLLFDRERFWSLADETYRQLNESDHFARLVQDDEWRERLLASSDQLADAGLEAEAIAQAAFHERQIVRADLGTIKTLVEGPAKTLLRSRLALRRRERFGQVRGDATAILDQADQVGLSTAMLGLRKDLRNAISHEDFTVEDGVLVLDRGRAFERRIDHDELTDQVLAALESTLAMHTSVVLALWQTDEKLAAESGRRAVSPEQACHLCFQLAGYPVTRATINDGQLRVEVWSEFDSKTLPSIAGLAGLLPRTSEWLTVASEYDGVLEGPLAAFRDFDQAAEGWERELALWRVLTTWQWIGEPIANGEVLRCFVASLAVHTKDEPPPVAIRRFRDLRRLAEERSDEELVTLTKDVASFHRHRATHLAMTHRQADRMMGYIEEWGVRPTNWPKLLPEG